MSSRITTERVQAQVQNFETIIEDIRDMGNTALAAIGELDEGVTSDMRYNVSGKTQTVMRSLVTIIETLHEGRGLLQNVVDMYTSTDAELKSQIESGVTEWTSGTRVGPDYTKYELGTKMPLDNADIVGDQCVGYAKERFRTEYGIELNPGNGNTLAANNVGNENVDVQMGGVDLLSSFSDDHFPCLVSADSVTSAGHTFIIEGVTRNGDGSIKDVYYSESNAGGFYGEDGEWKNPSKGYYKDINHKTPESWVEPDPDANEGFSYYDGVLQKLSYETFASKNWLGKNIRGYVFAK